MLRETLRVYWQAQLPTAGRGSRCVGGEEDRHLSRQVHGGTARPEIGTRQLELGAALRLGAVTGPDASPPAPTTQPVARRDVGSSAQSAKDNLVRSGKRAGRPFGFHEYIVSSMLTGDAADV